MGFDGAEASFFAHRGRRCCCFPWPSCSSSSSPSASARRRRRRRRAGGSARWMRSSRYGSGRSWWPGRGGRPSSGGSAAAGRGRKLNYDALNFDEGHTGYRDFSARLAAPPASAKSSMDLGGRSVPPLFNPPPPPLPDGRETARSHHSIGSERIGIPGQTSKDDEKAVAFDAAQQPHLRIPETEAGKTRRQYRSSLMLVSDSTLMKL